MATNPIRWAIDRQNQLLINSLGTFSASFGTLYQGDVRDVIVKVFDPPTDLTQSYTAVDLTGYTLRVVVGSANPTGGSPSTIFVPTPTFTWDSVNKWFTGSLDCTQANFLAALTTTTVQALIDIDIRLNTVQQTLIQSAITISASVDSGAVTSPNSPNLYRTAAESDGRYLIKGAKAGQSVIWKSQDGLSAFIQYCGNDGTMHFDPISPVPADIT